MRESHKDKTEKNKMKIVYCKFKIGSGPKLSSIIDSKRLHKGMRPHGRVFFKPLSRQNYVTLIYWLRITILLHEQLHFWSRQQVMRQRG